MMKLFCSDMDNTLIYSYKRPMGTDRICVEIYQGREVSFMSRYSFDSLKEICKRYLFVPTTTRSLEQYERIDLGIGCPEYALVCNGGVLLKNGRRDRKWYEGSLEETARARAGFPAAWKLLESDPDRCFEVRNVENLFLFTKSSRPEKTMEHLEQVLDPEENDILSNGIKVYVVPAKLNKGRALIRLKEHLHIHEAIAAGDSRFDLSMLKAADRAFAPESLSVEPGMDGNTTYFGGDLLFSDQLIRKLLENK